MEDLVEEVDIFMPQTLLDNVFVDNSPPDYGLDHGITSGSFNSDKVENSIPIPFK